MNSKYDWTLKFKAQLDKLDEQQTDYEQVQQLKKIKKLWDKKYKSLMDDMTMMDGESILIKLHNEIYLDLFQYIHDYIKQNQIPMDGITVSRSTIHTGRKRINVHLKKNEMKVPHSFRLVQNVNAFSPVTIIREMTRIDVGNTTWITLSVYEAFQKAKKENPDWLQKYCSDITFALDRIKEETQKAEATSSEETEEW